TVRLRRPGRRQIRTPGSPRLEPDEMTSAERLARLTFTRCIACGEQGTWGDTELCPDCLTATKGREITDRRLTMWQHTLAEMQVPAKYRDVPADMPLPLEYTMWRGRNPTIYVLVG